MSIITRNAQQLGNVIRTTRKEHGLTQAALAEKAGLRQATISKIESGNGATKIETVLTVIAMLGLDLSISERQRRNIEDIL